MSYSQNISSGFTKTKNRSSFISKQSGMCSYCTQDCANMCEIAQSAVLGAQTVYPVTTGNNQIASEKDYPIDYSHFNINGHVFGAKGAEETYESANIFNVNLEKTYGYYNKVKLALPVILPALIKLDWEDYFAGAAMAGVTCVIGEDAKNKDPNLKIENGKIIEFPFLKKVFDSFRKYYRGYGQIVLQCNVEDEMAGVAEIAIKKYGCEAIEIKFGQSAKGTQPVTKIKDIETAIEMKKRGNIVYPDPENVDVQKSYEEMSCPNFYMYSRLPLYNEEYLLKRTKELRLLGAKNIYFKMAGYDKEDIERVLKIASKAKVDMVTFDGAGGGSGYSPSKMMNEWCLPTVCLEDVVTRIVKRIKKSGSYIPAITITGGFASEDQVFKALSYGDGFVSSVGICRAAMAAAMSGKNIGNSIIKGNIPESLKQYGNTVQEIFADIPDLCSLYGKEARNFPTGAIGVFSYLNKIAFGLKHFCALNRIFQIDMLDKRCLIPLTRDIKDLMENKWFI